MHTYIHKINYYETDKMGITHHSNYVRFMEEARMDFLKSIGYGMRRLEGEGITSPVVSVECNYKRTTTFDDIISVEVFIENYTGVKLKLSYIMKNTENDEVVLTANSSHCFIDEKGRPIALRKHFPEFDSILRENVGR